MKEYLVMLDVETPPMDYQQFQRAFGVKPNLFTAKKVRNGILWRAESTIGARVPLVRHIQSMLKAIPMRSSKHPTRLTRQAFFNVGVMYDSYTCTVDLPYKCLDLMSRHGVGIQVSCYPTEFGKKKK